MKTEEQRLSEMITVTLNKREKYEKMWNRVEELLDGDYAPLIGEDLQGDLRVKSHLLSTAIESDVATAMPPPNFKFICVPSNKREDSDVNSAETAQRLAEYYTHKLDGYEVFEMCADDYFSVNRAINYIGFRPDTRPETEEERVKMQELGDVPTSPDKAIFSDGGEKKPGLPYMEKIDRINFLRAMGFKTIKSAWSNGGWVARRVFPHIDWTKNNPAIMAYSHKDFKLSKYKGDVKYPNADDPSDKNKKTTSYDSSEKNADMEYMYNIHWEIYEAPTKKYPKGLFTVFNHIQDKIIYRVEKMPLEEIDFPFCEVIDAMPKKGNYAVPKADRAIDPLIAHEYYETKALKNTSFAKTLIITETQPDEWAGKIESDSPIVTLQTQDARDTQSLRVETIEPSNQSANEGSLRSRAMFDNIMGRGNVDPRLGGKVATEMVFNQQDFTKRMNRHIVKLNKFIEDCVTKMLTVTKNRVSPEEQMRITRSTERVWTDHSQITLKGDYVMTVKSSTLKSMTEGERNQSLQMVSQFLISLEALPQYAGRVNGLEFARQWVEDLDFSTNKTFPEFESTGQFAEMLWMVSGQYANVEPDDNHTEHMSMMQEFLMQLKEAQLRLEAPEVKMFQQHYAEHQQYIDQQGQGSMNQTNAMRESGGASMGNGLTAPGEQ